MLVVCLLLGCVCLAARLGVSADRQVGGPDPHRSATKFTTLGATALVELRDGQCTE